jgi:hypothetical protein
MVDVFVFRRRRAASHCCSVEWADIVRARVLENDYDYDDGSVHARVRDAILIANANADSHSIVRASMSIVDPANGSANGDAHAHAHDDYARGSLLKLAEHRMKP